MTWNLSPSGREWRTCDCADWDKKDAPINPGEQHVRERVPNTPVEVCYHVNDVERVITLLIIRTMTE